MSRARAFTLIEVLVALVIVAFAVGALMTALTTSAANVERQRDSSFAQWIGFNQLALTRLNLQQPSIGTTTGELDFGLAHWAWEQTVEDIQIPGIRRITVKVKRTAALGGTGGASVNAPWVATVTGFKGDALSASSGQSVNWNGTQSLPGPRGANTTGNLDATSLASPTGNAAPGAGASPGNVPPARP